ncbi:MAG TPA: hypothetical protein VFK04_04935 [Gemmatimonadaceae bacterium]|nr:hypothetical protein [Gemmatimonadaceae bacterium]
MAHGRNEIRGWASESARRKRELLEEAGGGLTAEEVARRRGLPLVNIEHARTAGLLLAVHVETDEWLYPRLQFDDDAKPLPGLETVLRAFRVEDPWMQLSELLTPDPILGNRSIFTMLREQGEAAIPAALEAVREVG